MVEMGVDVGEGSWEERKAPLILTQDTISLT